MLRDLVLIFALEALYVSVTTVRWIILVRGRRYLASAISFFELILYVVALGMVVTKLGDPLRVVVYALGYAAGALVGSWVEERLALGFTIFHIITNTDTPLVSKLREAGLGITVWDAEGREGRRRMLMAVARRRWTHEVLELVERVDKHAFVIRTEPQAFKGGFLLKYMKTGETL